MAQETLESLIKVMFTLSLSEQEHVVTELQNNIRRHTNLAQPTDEQQSRLRQAYRDSQEGRVFSQAEAHRMMDEFVQKQYAATV